MPGAHGKMPAPGPLGHNLIGNLEYLREARGLSLRKLSAGLEVTGRPIPPLGLSRIVRGERRVDVDEAAALAEVLGVTADVLLSLPEAVRTGTAEPPAVLRESRNLVKVIEAALAGDPALAPGSVDRALRRVQIEVEELMEGTAPAPLSRV